MHLRYRFFLAACFLMLPTTPLASAGLRLSADVEGNNCLIPDPGPGQLVTVYVLVTTWGDGVTGAQFAAPVPSAAGLTHVGDTTTFPYHYTGNSQSGIGIPFGTCQSGTFPILTMYFVRSSAGEACTLYLAQAGGIYTDCSYSEFTLQEGDGVALNATTQCNPGVHDISPADGATEQPLTVSLTWTDGYPICNVPLATAPASGAQLYFGTSTNPPYFDYVTPPYSVGPLEPSTMYYWRVYTDPYGTPVMSFRTTNRVAVKPSTWGAIKALYR